jgi:sterol desaturase/sphingolipid hydroxylase (fatty acid hydroxylase superfamily)
MAGTRLEIDVSFALLWDKALAYLHNYYAGWSWHHLWRVVSDLDSWLAWPYVLSGLLVTWIVFRRSVRTNRLSPTVSFATFVAPREVYGHPSALVDYRYVTVDVVLNSVLFAPFVTGLSALVYRGVATVCPVVSLDGSGTALWIRATLLTIVTVLVSDFGFFLAHYLMHKSSLLWPFHEVHHSAKVLTPVTVYRVHPVERVVNAIVAGIVTGIAGALYSSWIGNDVSAATLFGVNVVLLAVFMFWVQLRHSHIWLSYPRVLSHVLVSPAQHQIHHSVDRRHHDKNFGVVFALWDWAFRSLYVPHEREALEFGVDATPEDFSTVGKLYWMPFVKASRTIAAKLGKGERVAVAAPVPR